MQKQKYDIPVSFHTPPPYIATLMDAVRAASDKDGAMRVRMDLSAKSAVAITGHWTSVDKRDRRETPRRVYVDTQLAEGNYNLTYMQKLFDENAVQRQYRPDQFNALQNDILQFLNVGRMPQA